LRHETFASLRDRGAKRAAHWKSIGRQRNVELQDASSASNNIV
jgi:hypothetical protein